jgi:hypothetical protein
VTFLVLTERRSTSPYHDSQTVPVASTTRN